MKLLLVTELEKQYGQAVENGGGKWRKSSPLVFSRLTFPAIRNNVGRTGLFRSYACVNK